MLGPRVKASGQLTRFLFPLLDGILAFDENVGPMIFFFLVKKKKLKLDKLFLSSQATVNNLGMWICC